MKVKVKDVMVSQSLKYCSPKTKLHTAALTMKENNCGALPVVDKDQRVLGIITDRDITLSMAHKQTKTLAKTTVEEIMPAEVHTVTTGDDISTAYREMRTNQIGRLPVVDELGKLKGIVSLHNLINMAISSGQEMGDIASPEENLLKTIHAVASRYNGDARAKKAPAVKWSKLEEQYEEAI